MDAVKSRMEEGVKLEALGETVVEEAGTNDPKVQLRGRIHADAILVNQSVRNKLILGDLENGVGFRRARLGAQGSIGEQVRWVSEFDFANGVVALKDVYLSAIDLPYLGVARIGHFPEPFSLEGETSSNSETFIERSPINSLDPDRNWGIAFFACNETRRATLQAGVFRSGTASNGADIGDDNDFAFTMRATCLPIFRDDGKRLVHVGAAFSQRFAKNDVVTFSQGPANSMLQFATDNPLTPFVPDIVLTASQNQLFNLQWATVRGPLSLQAEWNATTVDQVANDIVFLHGCYVSISYFLTGEHRAYNPEEGAFTATQVREPFFYSRKDCGRRGFGAWQLCARIGYLDFSDSDIPPAASGLLEGNRLTLLTVGVNWYLNNWAQIMLNYQHAVPIDPNDGPSAGDNLTMRTAVHW